MIRTTAFTSVLLFLGGCSALTSFGDYAEGDPADASTPDGESPDVGSPEAGPVDAGDDVSCPVPDSGMTALDAPIPRFPWNGYRVGGMSPELWWTPVDDAVGYEIQWASEDGGALDCDWTVTFTDYHASSEPEIHWTRGSALPDDGAVPAGARYCWRVRACRAEQRIDGDPCSTCLGEWSVPRYLMVGRTAGDFNGDGRAEVAGGAPRYHATSFEDSGTETGAVYVYDDSTDMMTTRIDSPVVMDEGTRFGFAVASADLNGDGYSDLVVGAPKQDNGMIHIYLGSATGLENAPLSFPSRRPRMDGSFGNTVVTLGDLNGDGYEDVAVGEPGGGDGTVQLLLGSAGNDSPIWISVLSDAHGRFGAAIAGNADIDGDGLVDFAVGAPTEDHGIVNVYLGCSMDGCTAIQTLGLERGTLFGHGMAMGIVDRSSPHAELLVANRGTASGVISRWQYHPGSEPAFTSTMMVSPEINARNFGRALCLTTWNGMPRLITADLATSGSIYVNTSFDGTAVWTPLEFPAGATNGNGWSIGCHGDVYGDGETDIIVGGVGTFDQDATTPAGQVHVFDSNQSIDAPGFRLQPAFEADWFGWSVAP